MSISTTRAADGADRRRKDELGTSHRTARGQPALVERGDTTVATIRVAVQRPKRNSEDQGAGFFDVTAFGAQARNVARYLDTGRLVGVSGRLRQQTWEQDGQRRQKVDIVAAPYGIQFLDAPRGDDWDEVPEPADDDIPF